MTINVWVNVASIGEIFVRRARAEARAQYSRSNAGVEELKGGPLSRESARDNRGLHASLPLFSLGISLQGLYTWVIRPVCPRALELHLAHRRGDSLFCCLRDDEVAEVRVRFLVVHQTVLQSVL